jgi:hypothetical protein
MNRRTFLAGAGCGVACSVFGRQAGALAPAASATLTITENGPRYRVPRNYTGLSYELAQLTEPEFFSAGHRDLIALCRRLSPRGVLRLGGNTSEFCWFQAEPSTPAPQLPVPSGNLSANWMPHRLFAIQPAAIDSLAGFLNASGWSAIYGLNLGHSSPERAAVEAAYVASKLGPALLFFQIGNEPNYYGDPNNGTRPAGWSFEDYARQWLSFANAILAKVPGARFGGPDVGSTEWITRFGREVGPKLPGHVVALTGHYYAEGPPDDPRMTTTRLLAGDPEIATSMRTIAPVAEQHGLIYRMTEGNSCYRGGKPGMSNAFASALWAGDYMLLLASLGCAGVNLHGGDSRFLSAGLGNHNPGVRVAGVPGKRRNGFYTPISTEQGEPAFPMPIFYGMLLANQFAGTTILPCELTGSEHGTAYVAKSDESGRYQIAVFNKDERSPISLQIKGPQTFRKGSLWRLQAPALDATTGITLGGAGIAADAAWQPRAQPVNRTDESFRIQVPQASAALIFLE